MKIVTMHQPNYLPWLGLFDRIAHSDCFVIMDNLPYTRQSVTNRNRIRTKEGWSYLTIPVGSKSYGLPIRNVALPRDDGWMATHWKRIKDNYAKSDFLNLYKDFFDDLYQRNFEYLGEINVEIMSYLLNCFEIDVEVMTMSEMSVDVGSDTTDVLIEVLKGAGADTYLSGPSGRNYLHFEKFPQNDLGLRFLKFQHPVYRQRWPGFEPAMAAIDLLFNLGPQAGDIIKASGSIEEPE